MDWIVKAVAIFEVEADTEEEALEEAWLMADEQAGDTHFVDMVKFSAEKAVQP